jgi:hypothetical protein
MPRWLVLTVVSFLGCAAPSAGALRPGLANAPRLGGTGVADERLSDVVSNGDDACGLRAEHGPLRNRIPACTVVTVPAPGPSAFRPSAGRAQPGLVVPWVQHFYVGWPCARPTTGGASTLALATTSTSTCSTR